MLTEEVVNMGQMLRSFTGEFRSKAIKLIR
jgi:hypothetical protein